ncbi:similar to Saccharomyces cerevisiae YCR011C ADP1 Putative ATP-dependent permease of the ABC transporter family of proteins [Maudiozyma barnettii]|uniref:Similar to Saccharomyces cerevisiae YCR011C ADP1 Putative ATP-dependent permease of the ABC transporter family of proteins n=1 Tax=Maudiozyma barnettii TaxID=61262 RepID=A0A8H2VFQ5_9SACH|nr:putative ATP-dependent permease ADP1 [Kazachstania barnettii]CAB4254686.1 similar to Saccharomyces cerevisiae YCR011C ADP1 Putative ATP-dependent permease of the ABC transporter family of proteins [Kazachstania barnettii]CAD1782728.1 similar to Saccharomyces cerevisiae YCR011C ADP1 Putative ATP-dependent permease of the ABC transporter family of proteins [Kazachstania barnettii]
MRNFSFKNSCIYDKFVPYSIICLILSYHVLALNDNKDISLNNAGLLIPKQNSDILAAALNLDRNNNYNSYNNNNRGDNDKCPPCFNCMLPIFECKQYSQCNEFSGRCDCIDGFGGDDCSIPLCGSLADDNNNRPQRSSNDSSCLCDDGWSGINCNICQEDSVCDVFMPDNSVKGTCYKKGMIVNRLHQGCDVTNQKILQILDGKIPQATFSCDKEKDLCNFQFWIDQIESFYCELDTCQFNYDISKNTSHYNCDNVQCKCLPGTMLCGANGSIDIGEFLSETIKGPGDFTCDLETRKCVFSEPSMNDLISTIFGDPYITLKCESGECLHYSEIPGYKSPADQGNMTLRGKIILALTSIAVLAVATMTVFYISNSPLFKHPIFLGDDSDLTRDIDDNNNFLKSDLLTTFSFENIKYTVPPIGSKSQSMTTVLKNITGCVKPGQMLAIMGGSGAGKTTLLDILAMKRKSGVVDGTIKINGIEVPKKQFSKLIGFVDQENYLLPTLTVYETILNSALLRLPRSMSLRAKQARVIQVLEQLRIFDIKDRIIGDEFQRGISGGEKRRVSIACELVTSPLILFLDEPTSGLDANNANNVVECLWKLAKDYNRTLVLSIHQPRSNIFNLFDKLVLLSNGNMIYSGDVIGINDYLLNNGFKCPLNYNVADYLIDITFGSNRQLGNVDATADLERGIIDIDEQDQERRTDNGIHIIHNDTTTTLGSHSLNRSTTQNEWEHFAEHRDEIRGLLQDGSDRQATGGTIVELSNTEFLTEKYKESPNYASLLQDISDINNFDNAESVSLLQQIEIPRKHKPATFSQQLSILCSRSFKNIYRNPKLLLANYLLTILLSLFLGTLYYDVSIDISGFQNRMGLFFFILTYFGFVTFTGLSSFAQERLIFLKERSNNYYSPLAYYISKILSDVLPLRVIPPILMTIIVYPLIGLNNGDNALLKCILILVLFNVGIALEILSLGIMFESLNNSIIASVLVLLASILFSGLFINTQELTNIVFKDLKNVSIFYYAYESLLINEVKTLMLKERKFGLNIEVPGATILSTFGFQVQNLIFDLKVLGLFNIIFLIIGYLALRWIVIEQR